MPISRVLHEAERWNTWCSPLSGTVLVLQCFPQEHTEWRRWGHSSPSSPVMRFGPAASQSHARASRPRLDGPVWCVWTDVCVCVVQVWLCRQSLLEKQETIPPATVIYSLRTSAAARPLTLWGLWVMTGCFCEKNFPFYLIKCGAWQTPHSMVCLTAFHSSYLRRKLWLG